MLSPSGQKSQFGYGVHSDLNDQNLFHSTIDPPPLGVPGVSKNLDDQTEVHSGELEHYDSAKI